MTDVDGSVAVIELAMPSTTEVRWHPPTITQSEQFVDSLRTVIRWSRSKIGLSPEAEPVAAADHRRLAAGEEFP